MVITEVVWISPEQFLLRVMNRVQDSQRVYTVSQMNSTWNAKTIQKEDSVDGAWFNNVCFFLLGKKDFMTG